MVPASLFAISHHYLASRAWISPDSGVQHKVVVVPETARNTLYFVSALSVCLGAGREGRQPAKKNFNLFQLLEENEKVFYLPHSFSARWPTSFDVLGFKRGTPRSSEYFSLGQAGMVGYSIVS